MAKLGADADAAQGPGVGDPRRRPRPACCSRSPTRRRPSSCPDRAGRRQARRLDPPRVRHARSPPPSAPRPPSSPRPGSCSASPPAPTSSCAAKRPSSPSTAPPISPTATGSSNPSAPARRSLWRPQIDTAAGPPGNCRLVSGSEAGSNGPYCCWHLTGRKAFRRYRFERGLVNSVGPRAPECASRFPRNASLPALLFLAGCNRGILDPVGPVGAGRKDDPHQFDRDHAGDHHPDDDRDHRIRLVVPARQPQGDLPSRLGIFGRDRNGRLVDPGADHHAARRHRLDRQPRPRAEQAAQVRRAPPLKVESSRSIGNGCSSTPTRASRPSTSWSSRPERRSISG